MNTPLTIYNFNNFNNELYIMNTIILIIDDKFIYVTFFIDIKSYK